MGGGLALEQAIPFGRVWSFPTEIKTVKASIGGYADFISYSDIADATFIDPVVERCAQELAYRNALSIRLSSTVRLSA